VFHRRPIDVSSPGSQLPHHRGQIEVQTFAEHSIFVEVENGAKANVHRSTARRQPGPWTILARDTMAVEAAG